MTNEKRETLWDYLSCPRTQELEGVDHDSVLSFSDIVQTHIFSTTFLYIIEKRIRNRGLKKPQNINKWEHQSIVPAIWEDFTWKHDLPLEMGIHGLLTKVHQIRRLSEPKAICSATLVLGPSYYSELTVSLCPVYLSCKNKTAGVIRMQGSDKPSLCTRTSG